MCEQAVIHSLACFFLIYHVTMFHLAFILFSPKVIDGIFYIDSATTEIYTLSPRDALPIYSHPSRTTGVSHIPSSAASRRRPQVFQLEIAIAPVCTPVPSRIPSYA